MMERSNSLKEDSVAVALLFGLALVYFLPVLLKGNELVLSREGTDTWSQYFYWRHFGFGSFARGEIPLWNPYIFSGTPYIAGIQSAIFYPLNILYLFFDIPFAINLSVALHCFLASLFTYLFARYIDISRPGAVLAALTFTYGAPYFLHIYPGHLSNLSTMVWLPLMFMGVEAFLRNRKIGYAVLSGVPLSMQVLAGHPQYLFYSAIAISLYFLLRLLVGREFREVPYCLAGFCLLVITGISLSAVQIIPTLELVTYSVREALSYEWISIFSFPPENLITLLVPDFFGNMLSVPYWGKNYLWEMSVYLGIIPLILAVTAIILDRNRYVIVFSLIAAVSLILALGKYTPLLSLLYDYAPGFDKFRGLSKFAFVFSFAGSMIAGYGLRSLTSLVVERGPKLRCLSYTLLGISLLLALLGVLGWLYGQDLWRSTIEAFVAGEDRYDPPPALTEDFFDASTGAALWGIFKASILLISVCGALLVFAKFKRAPIQLLGVALLALAAIDLWDFGSRYLVTFDPRDVYMDKELRGFLKSDNEPFRVATPVFPLVDRGMIEGIENVGGYDAIVMNNYSEFVNFTQGLPLHEPNTAMTINAASPLLNLLNVKYYILDPGMNVELPNLSLIFQTDRYKIYRNKDALPRSFIVHDAWVINDRDTILRQMASPVFSPTSYAIIEEKINTLPYHATAQSPLPKIIEHHPNRVTLEADPKEAGLLVLADSYYPGWKAFVDGKETRIYRTNYVMRGIFLPAGRHLVEFRYDPASFKIGVIISLTSLVIVAGFLAWFCVRGRITRHRQALK